MASNYEGVEENFFEEQVDDKIKVTPKSTPNSNVLWAMQNLQPFYNEDDNMTIKQAA